MVAAVLGLATLSVVSNIVVPGEDLSLQQPWTLLRRTLSALLNTGTVWAALPILAGWWAVRMVPGAVAGLLVGEVSLLLHYLLGVAIGWFEWSTFPQNATWFVSAVVLCPLLGAAGAIARHDDWFGLVARLIVPVGAIAEPWFLGMFWPEPLFPWAIRWALIICGAVLTTAGVVGLVWVLRRWVIRGSTHRSSTSLGQSDDVVRAGPPR